jgi:hypothetical protein
MRGLRLQEGTPFKFHEGLPELLLRVHHYRAGRVFRIRFED